MIKTIFSEQGRKNVLGAWLSDGHGFYILTDLNKEYTGIGLYDAFNSKLNWISTNTTDFDHDIESIVLGKDRTLLIWNTNENGYSKIYFKELEKNNGTSNQQQLLTIKKARNGIINQLRVSSDDKRIGFLMSTPTSPYDIYVIDLETKEIQKITNALLSNIPNAIMVEPEVLCYESFDGLQIPFFLYKPRNASKRKNKKKKIGAVLSIHGGPIAQERPEYAHDGFYQSACPPGTILLWQQHLSLTSSS